MKGILFKPWKIVYIAEHPDIEIQTRRVIKHPAVPNSDIVSLKEYRYVPLQKDKHFQDVPEGYYAILNCNANQDFSSTYFRCRYQQGETVYLKEAWATAPWFEGENIVWYRDNEQPISIPIKWHSPMMMPEWAARYFIVIESVRAERVQEITETDVEWEGTPMIAPRPSGVSKDDFRVLWNSINPNYPWESNPFVFVYTFRLKGELK
jgi:hypothetical protein